MKITKVLTAIAAIALSVTLQGASCGGGGTPGPVPTPTPTPPPPVSQVKYLDLLLRIDGVKLVRPNQPTAFVPYGAIQCCMPAPAEVGNSRWPLASESWMDYTKANMFHFRMGPFYADAAHESDWADIGGPYLGDGPEFNPAFDTKVQALLDHAGSKGANVEIVIIDTWYCKHAASNWGDQQMPWPQADIDACGKAMTPVQERFIRHVVQVTGEYANVIYLTDNEGGEIRGTKREWYVAVRDIIRDEEQKLAHPVDHIIGTNNTDFCDGPFDYCATHAREALTQPIAGKHTENNERNPQFSVEQEYANFVGARDVGLNYWYWRAEQTEAQMKETLDLFRSGNGGVPVGCFAPEAEDPAWAQPPIDGRAPRMLAALNAAKLVVGDRTGKVGPCPGGDPAAVHCQQNETLALLASELRKQGYCASGPWTDAVAILAPDALYEEMHAVAFGTGGYTQSPYRYAWKYNGTVTPPPPSCSVDVPTLDEISCKLHQATNHIYDCTPKYRGAPILPEGNPERSACEEKSCGGVPTYSITQPGQSVELVPRDNPYQFQLRGSGTVQLHCACPATGSADICYSKTFTQ